MNSLNEYDTIEYDFDYYGPAHTVTIGWLMVATNTMTYRLISSPLSLSTIEPIDHQAFDF